MVTTSPPRGPVTSTEEERLELQEAARLLGDHPGRVSLTDEHGHRIELPETAARLVRRVVQALAQGYPVEVNVLPKALTIGHAAELLDLRRQDVVRLLDEGEIPFVEDTDGLQRIRFEDVMAYKPKRDAERRAAMEEIVRISEELGLYELEAASENPPIVSRHGKSMEPGDS
jgi:excisionase family DNA binding protein